MWPFKKKQRGRKRAFKAGGSGRLIEGWKSTPTSANYDIKAGLTQLRARSRESYQNNEYTKQFVRLARTNVVGHNGIQLQSRVRTSRGDLDQVAARAIEDAWRDWSRRGNSDVTGRKSWWQIQNDFIQSVAVDGEFLALKVPARPYGFKIRVLDPEMLPLGLSKDMGNGRRIECGIEYDAMDAPVAYWLRKKTNDGSYSDQLPEHHTRFPAAQVIHEFLPEFAIQNRGIPLTTVGLYRLGMLDGYQEAEIIAARVASASMGFFEQTADAEGMGYTGDNADDENEGDFEFHAEPGVFRTLPPGLTLKDWSPSRPTSVYEAFVRNCLQQFASGLGVSYAGLANDYSGANYSSLRQALLVERELWMMLQTWAAEVLHDQVFDGWIQAALSFGKITINGKEPIRKPEAYAAREWQGRRWQWVDPQKELAAIEKAVALNVRSVPEVIREMGRDPDNVLAEIAAWNEKLKAAGISQPEATAGLAATMTGGDDEETD